VSAVGPDGAPQSAYREGPPVVVEVKLS